MIYLDNAATSWPKPPQVVAAMTDALVRCGANPGRGGHRLALEASRLVEACRQDAALLLGASPERIIFTRNCTEALNLAILGTLKSGDEVVCSHAEHNAVMRPLAQLVRRGDVRVRILRPDDRGLLQPQTLRHALTPATTLVIISHASNVTGVVQPIAALSAVCREVGVPLLVDAAQTAGVLDVSLGALGADMVAMPGHKGLMGPHGTGLLALGAGMDPEPLLYGGTGSLSERLDQPGILPDRYESGTQNLPGIAGLQAGLAFVKAHGDALHQYELALTDRLRQQLAEIPGLRILGDPTAPHIGVTSVVPNMLDTGALADDLNQTGVAVRSGLHCAPSIHAWLGTLHTGALRFSVGPYTTEREVDDAAALLSALVHNA